MSIRDVIAQADRLMSGPEFEQFLRDIWFADMNAKLGAEEAEDEADTA